MSNFIFKPAIRQNVGLIIGLIAPSGGGKTLSALRLAMGLSNGKKPAMIDTEAGRGLHYADMYNYDYGELSPPFRPDNYITAIEAADKAGYPVIIVDSCSHEHAGDGGLLEWHEEELTRMAGDDWKKRESCKMTAWIKPKMSHKKFMSRLLQIKAHLILCFRAEEKTGIEKDAKTGKTVIIQKGFQPICEKNMPYELTMSFILTPDRPGIPQPIKLQEQHKDAIDLSKPLDEEAGRKLLEWASSAKAEKPKTIIKEFTKEQWLGIIAFGANKSLNGKETQTLFKWVAEQNGLPPRSIEAYEIMDTQDKFGSQLEKYLEATV